MKKQLFITALALLQATAMSWGAKVMSLPMEIDGDRLGGGNVSLSVEGRFAPMQIAGKEGNAWRTDGNSSRATGQIETMIVDGDRMTASLRFAVDTYAIVEHETGTTRHVEIMSCLNEAAHTGFGFYMNRTGNYMARVYVGGEPVEIVAEDKVPLWEWNDLSVTVDGNLVRLYRNGDLKGERRANASGVKAGNSTIYVGRANAHGDIGGTETCGFNGAFDDLSVYDEVILPNYKASYADLNPPSDRYDSDLMRARFHGQPGMNWTNETHGLFYNSGGDRKWHVFFQRTGSTPMMSHQHWGHIVSDDLITWRDEKPALAPSEFYDIKGCWSGCVFSDHAFNNGNPTIIYTGVDFARPYAATAYCDDNLNMREWHRDQSNPIYVTDNCGDARDTYFYRTDSENAYFLIGARDAVHYYRWNDGHWDYKGEFYHTEPGVDSGHNTEMPNVTRIGDKWMMTTSPLAGMYGTTCLYRTGDISDGRFINYSGAERVDFFGCDGYGLLSPSPGTMPDGRTIAIGIVPDKLPGDLNIRHGYAHLYSLPREWSLDQQGRLMQKPYEGIYQYRNKTLMKKESGITLDGTLNLHPVRGREAEVCATFELGERPAGINFFKDVSGNKAFISYNPTTKEIRIDYSRIRHYGNGKDSFSSILPLGPGVGEELKLHLFIDHSIVDIFVNDRYAASVRIFAEDENADLIEIFSEGPTNIISLEAYILGEGYTSEEPVVPPTPETLESTGRVALYLGYPDAGSLISDTDAKEEKAVYNYFVENFGESRVLFSGDIDRISVSDFDMIWVNCDRRNINRGWENLPDDYKRPDLVTSLRNYSASGGNLYLTKMASQLVVAIGRVAEPGDAIVWGNGTGDIKDDNWNMNVRHYGNDWAETHPMLAGLDFHEEGDRLNLTLMSGRHRREDHNCMWELSRFGSHDRFCADNRARVIGTWGHEGGWSHAGLIEFMPLQADDNITERITSPSAIKARKGTVIVNGLAAYEWAPEEGVNESIDNIKALTRNVICYLSPVEDISTGIEATEDTCGQIPIYYNLQGIRIEKPTKGIYIEVRGRESSKIML